ncbi:hypothetical protein FN846DRAFT_902333 [Sphaerosporella brunnea]|uniref:Uncharacterized protein n=1 Tax=Sphaerosporella brunnea TaxID=1250544 RepID=A0A5J5FAY0_9PEZI|nr:hypothetical protein FN846DRAFT_902333 [Sphaerosporella brunnea]
MPGNRNTQNEQSNTPTEDSNTQSEQSEAQKQQAHKERIRSLVHGFIFATLETISTLKDSDPVPGFAQGRAFAQELKRALRGGEGKPPPRDPQFVARTNVPEKETFDFGYVSPPPGIGTRKAYGVTQREGTTGGMELRPLVEEDADMSSERSRTRVQRGESLDIMDPLP